MTRVLPRHTGRTAFHVVTGKLFNHDIVKFAGPVLWKHQGLIMDKLLGRWNIELWAGKLGRTDEHEVWTLDGVQRCRSCL